MNYYKTDKDIVVNTSTGETYTIEAGKYVVEEASGMLIACTDDNLQENIARIEADIVVRDIAWAEELARREAEAEAEAEAQEQEEGTLEDLLINELGV
jgi:hypothetical protein